MGLDGLKSTDYLLALALAYFVIKELIGLIKIKMQDKSIPSNKTDETELLYRQNMMTQHENMTEALTTCVNLCKNTNYKINDIEKDVAVIKDRTDK